MKHPTSPWLAACALTIALQPASTLAQAQTQSAENPLAATQFAAKQPITPRVIWEYDTGKFPPLSIVIDERGRDCMYLALRDAGLAVVDISTAKPREMARLTTNQLCQLDVMYVAQAGNYLYLALGNFFNARGAKSGLGVVDISDPRRPQVKSIWLSPGVARGSAAVLVEGKLAFLGTMSEGVSIFDIAEPTRIVRIGTIQPDIHFPTKNPNRIHHPNARGLALRDNLLYVAYDAGGLRVIDVSNPRLPRAIGRYVNMRMLKKPQAFNGLVLHDKYAYVAVDYAGLEILDIGNPRNIRQVGWWNPWNAHTLANVWLNSPGHTNQIAFDANKKLVYLSAGDSELQMVDVSDPTRPTLAGSFGQPKNRHGVWSLTRHDGTLYLGYIQTLIPFRGTWAGVKALR